MPTVIKPATKPALRFARGSDLLGCTVQGDFGELIRLVCPGKDGKGCDTSFAVPSFEAKIAAGKGLTYRCPGCGGGARLETTTLKADGPPRANTVGASLLLTAADLWGDREFDVWSLTVAAWKRDPDRFGIPGHPQYPNSNRVIVELCMTRPGGFSRYVERVAPNTFILTTAGLRAAKALRAGK